MSRAARRRRARDAGRRDSRARIDSEFLREIEKADFVIQEAARHGIYFAIEGNKLAVPVPLNLAPDSWRSFRRAILDNLRLITGATRAREGSL